MGSRQRDLRPARAGNSRTTGRGCRRGDRQVLQTAASPRPGRRGPARGWASREPGGPGEGQKRITRSSAGELAGCAAAVRPWRWESSQPQSFVARRTGRTGIAGRPIRHDRAGPFGRLRLCRQAQAWQP